MPEAVNARTFRNITNGGAVQGGNGIFFELEFDDRSREALHCDVSLVPKLIGNLRQYGAMANAVRINPGAGLLDVSVPYHIKQVTRSGHTDDGKTISLEVGVADGFPLQLAMTPDQARQTIEHLQRELATVAKPAPPDRRN